MYTGMWFCLDTQYEEGRVDTSLFVICFPVWAEGRKVWAGVRKRMGQDKKPNYTLTFYYIKITELFPKNESDNTVCTLGITLKRKAAVSTHASFAVWVSSRKAHCLVLPFSRAYWQALLRMMLIHPKTAVPDLLLWICKSVYMKTSFNHSFVGKLSMMSLNLVLPAVLFAH